MSFLPGLIVVVYLIVLFLLSAFFVKRALNSYEEYAFCGRGLTIGFVFFTYLGTWIGGGTIIGLAGSALEKGMNQYWIFAMSCIVGFFFAFLFISKIRALQLRSLGELFALRFPGRKGIIRIPVAVSVLIRNVTMVGMQFTALGYMITYTMNIDKNIAILIVFLLITGYTCLSGLWAVVSTDVLQGLMQTIGMGMLLFFSVKLNDGISNIWGFYSSIGKEYQLSLFDPTHGFQGILLYFICFGTFFLMGDQSDWERIYSSRTDKTAFWGYLIPLTITLILLLIPAFIGIFHATQGIEFQIQEYFLYWFIFEKIAPITGLFILLTLFSAVMSTADSFIIASGTIFANDIVKKFLNPNASDKELIFWTRMAVIVAGAVGFAFAINIPNIILLWTSGIAIATIIVIPEYLMLWFSKSASTDGAIVGMSIGIIYCISLLLSGSSFNFYTILIGCMLNIFAAVSITLIGGKAGENEYLTTYYFSPKLKKVPHIPR